MKGNSILDHLEEFLAPSKCLVKKLPINIDQLEGIDKLNTPRYISMWNHREALSLTLALRKDTPKEMTFERSIGRKHLFWTSRLPSLGVTSLPQPSMSGGLL